MARMIVNGDGREIRPLDLYHLFNGEPVEGLPDWTSPEAVRFTDALNRVDAVLGGLYERVRSLKVQLAEIYQDDRMLGIASFEEFRIRVQELVQERGGEIGQLSVDILAAVLEAQRHLTSHHLSDEER